MARVGGRSMKVPYYYERKGRAYWEPRGKVPAGFAARPLGPAGEEARMAAARLYNAMWQVRRGAAGGEQDNRPKWPKGTVGEAWEAYRRTIEWTKKKPRTREEWDRVWVRLSPVFGDVKPNTITLIDISAWRAQIEQHVSQREAHRCIKIWRALWQVMAAMKYCDADNDPSFGVRNTEPTPRDASWNEWEIARIAKRAWRDGYKGLAALIAVAWDGMMSPVDARTLCPPQRVRHGSHQAFAITRGKTGATAYAPLTRRSAKVLDAYLADRKIIEIDKPIFRTRGATTTAKGGRPQSPAAYTKNQLSKDFRIVRAAVFGESEQRKLSDMRRSGALEAAAGSVDPKALSDVMGNTIAQSRTLQRTYTPAQIATAATVPEARKKGRRARTANETGS